MTARAVPAARATRIACLVDVPLGNGSKLAIAEGLAAFIDSARTVGGLGAVRFIRRYGRLRWRNDCV